MKKSLLTVTIALGLTFNIQAQGFLSSIKDKLTGSEQQQQQQAAPAQAQATPAPAEGGRVVKGEGGKNVRIVQGEGTPAANPTKTPTREQIKAGANKIKSQLVPERVPANLFDRYQGTWTGDFWVYSPQGTLQETKAVKIEYAKNGKQLEMKTFYADRLGQQWVVAETAVYENEGDKVNVTIRRPSNDTATQTGRYNDGSLFLVANIQDGVEHYRERIDGKRLLVDGFGVYGGAGADAHVFIGRFVRQ